MDDRSFNGTVALTWAVISLSELELREIINAYAIGSSSNLQAALASLISQAAHISVGGNSSPCQFNDVMTTINRITRQTMDERAGEYWDRPLNNTVYDTLRRALGAMSYYGENDTNSYTLGVLSSVLTSADVSPLRTMFSSFARLTKPNARPTLTSYICLPDTFPAAQFYAEPDVNAAAINISGTRTLVIRGNEIVADEVAVLVDVDMCKLIDTDVTIDITGNLPVNTYQWNLGGTVRRVLSSYSSLRLNPDNQQRQFTISGLGDAPNTYNNSIVSSINATPRIRTVP